MKLLIPLLVVTSIAEAKTNLFTANNIEDEKSANYESPTATTTSKKQTTPTLAKKDSDISTRSWSMVPHGQSTIVNKNAALPLKDFKPGEIVDAVIPMSVSAFSEGKAPVVAEVRRAGRVYVLWGDAVLEKISKRITIEFTGIREKHSDHVFNFKASALDQDGTLGLIGEPHTGETQAFVGELLSAAAAGFSDASIRRGTNALGNSVEEHSLDTQTKRAFSSAMLKSAERFGEKARAAPEFSILTGPTRAKLLIGSRESSL